MYLELSFSDFVDLCEKSCHYSYEAMEAMWYFFDGYEGVTGEKVKFDAPSLRGMFTEFKSFDEFHREFPEYDSVEEAEESNHFVFVEELDNGHILVANYN